MLQANAYDSADKKLQEELSKLKTHSRRSKQEREQLDQLLTASSHKHAQQEYQIQTLQVAASLSQNYSSILYRSSSMTSNQARK